MKTINSLFENIKLRNVLIILLGSAIVAFGIYNIHDVSEVTEGGILGLDLLLEHHFKISPAVTNFTFSAVCFFLGWKALGREFIIYSAVSVSSFSLFYIVLEKTPRLFPQIAEHPLIAAAAGAVFVGIGAGITVRSGGAQSGDDALAMALNHRFGWKYSAIYFVSDAVVLTLSLTYIPVRRILYSFLTIILSGQILEIVISYKNKKR